MFGIGLFELFIIILFVLVVYGPNKLPDFMQRVASFFVKGKRITRNVQATMHEILYEANIESETKKTKIETPTDHPPEKDKTF